MKYKNLRGFSLGIILILILSVISNASIIGNYFESNSKIKLVSAQELPQCPGKNVVTYEQGGCGYYSGYKEGCENSTLFYEGKYTPCVYLPNNICSAVGGQCSMERGTGQQEKPLPSCDYDWTGEKNACNSSACWGSFYNPQENKYYNCRENEAGECIQEECESKCGNGIIDAGEECDPPGVNNYACKLSETHKCDYNCQCEKPEKCTGTYVSDCQCDPWFTGWNEQEKRDYYEKECSECPEDCTNSFTLVDPTDPNKGGVYCTYYEGGGEIESCKEYGYPRRKCEAGTKTCSLNCGEDKDLDGYYIYPDDLSTQTQEYQKLIKRICPQDCYDENKPKQGSMQEKIFGDNVCNIGCCVVNFTSVAWASTEEECEKKYHNMALPEAPQKYPFFREAKMCEDAERGKSELKLIGPKKAEYMCTGDNLIKYSSCGTCINPGAKEVCDGVDNNCGEGTCYMKADYGKGNFWSILETHEVNPNDPQPNKPVSCSNDLECETKAKMFQAKMFQKNRKYVSVEKTECKNIDETVRVSNGERCGGEEQCVWFGIGKEVTHPHEAGPPAIVGISKEVIFMPGGILSGTEGYGWDENGYGWTNKKDAFCGVRKITSGIRTASESQGTPQCPDGWTLIETQTLGGTIYSYCKKIEIDTCFNQGVEGSFLNSPDAGFDLNKFKQLANSPDFKELFNNISWQTACVKKNTCIDQVDNDGPENFVEAAKSMYKDQIFPENQEEYSSKESNITFIINPSTWPLRLTDVDDPGCHNIKRDDPEHKDYCITEPDLTFSKDDLCYCLDQDKDGFCGCVKGFKAGGIEAPTCDVNYYKDYDKGIAVSGIAQKSKLFPDCDDNPYDDQFNDPNDKRIGQYQYYHGEVCCKITKILSSGYGSDTTYKWLMPGDCANQKKDLFVSRVVTDDNCINAGEEKPFNPKYRGNLFLRFGPHIGEKLRAWHVHPFARIMPENISYSKYTTSSYCSYGTDINCNKNLEKGYNFLELTAGITPFDYDTTTGVETELSSSRNSDLFCHTKNPYVEEIKKTFFQSIPSMLIFYVAFIVVSALFPPSIPVITWGVAFTSVGYGGYKLGNYLEKIIKAKEYGTTAKQALILPSNVENLGEAIGALGIGFTSALIETRMGKNYKIPVRKVLEAVSEKGKQLTKPVSEKGKQLTIAVIEGMKKASKNGGRCVLEAGKKALSLFKGGCFLAGTKVMLANGSYKNIEDIKIGDKIAAFNITSNKQENASVLTTFIRNDTDYLIIKYQILENEK